MRRIIHMSDLHVGHEDLGDRFRAVVERLAFEKGDKATEYVIVITGDLVERAAGRGLHDEVQMGLDRCRVAGFDHILVIPGNHDYGTGSRVDKRFVAEFKESFFGTVLDYPKKDIIDGVAFLGLDSMAEELHWYDELWAQGELGSRQIRDLEQVLRSEEVKACRKRVIYLHHHPFDAYAFHQLRDSDHLAEALTGVIREGISIDAILYGHNHAGKVHNGRWGIRRCYDAGSATLKGRSSIVAWMSWFQVREATRVIDLEKDPAHDYELPLLT